MSRPLCIAAVQMPSAAEGSGNEEKQAALFNAAASWLERAGKLGADIACVGETFNILGLSLTHENTATTVAASLETARARFGPLAKRLRMAIIAPILAVVDGRVRNVALVFDKDGRLAGRYTKVHCIENEKALGVVPGDEWPVFDIAGARIGIQICHDNSFPESARCLALNGAEVIFWPHVMGGWGGEFMDILLRAPAIHNGVHHVPVCFGCPTDRAWRPGMLIGRSSIIGPDATIVADAGRHPGIAIARIDLDAPRVATCFTRDGDWVWKNDMVRDRRPETYGSIVRPSVPMEPIPAKSR
jgi:predicted amidohydrolase